MKIYNQKTTSDTGRSMVEILGVLAVIGVLSVGGIAGYKMAMEKYRSNQVVDMANKYAVIAYSAFMTNKMMNNGTEDSSVIPAFVDTGLYTSPTGSATNVVNGTTIGNATVTESSVSIPLSFTEKKVCEAVATSLGAVATAVEGETLSVSSCAASGGTISAVFKQS